MRRLITTALFVIVFLFLCGLAMAQHSNLTIGETALYLADKVNDEEFSQAANNIAFSAFIEKDPQRAWGLWGERYSAAEQKMMQGLSGEQKVVFEKYRARVRDVVNLLGLTQVLTYTKEPGKAAELAKQLPADPVAFEQDIRALLAELLELKNLFPGSEEDVEADTAPSTPEDLANTGLAYLKTSIGVSWIQYDLGKARAFLESAAPNVMMLREKDDQLRLLYTLALFCSVVSPDTTLQCLERANQEAAALDEFDQEDAQEALSVVHFGVRLMEVGAGDLFSPTGELKVTDLSALRHLTFTPVPGSEGKLAELVQTAHQMARSDKQSHQLCALVTAFIVHLYGMDTEALALVDEVTNSVDNAGESSPLEPALVIIDHYLKPEEAGQRIRDYVSAQVRLQPTFAGNPLDDLRAYLMGLATANDPADPLLTDEDCQFLEREIAGNIFLTGDRAAMLSLLAVMSGEARRAELTRQIDDTHTELRRERPEVAYRLTGALLTNQAPFDGRSARQYVDTLMDEMKDTDEENRLDAVFQLLDNFEQCLQGVPHRSGWEIQLGRVLGG